MNIPPAYGENADLDPILSRVGQGRVSTLRDRLLLIHRGMILIAVFGIISMKPFFADTPVVSGLAICFFVLMAVLNARVGLHVRRLNFSMMTVREAILEIASIRSERYRVRAIGLTLGIPLVGGMIYTFTDSFGVYVLYGCMAGALIGVVFGLLIHRRTMSIIREMEEQLRIEN